MLFGVKLGTRSSRPSTKLNFYYRDGKYYFMVGKDLDIAAEIVGVESDDAGNRVVTVQLTENGAYAGKIELTAASADSENSMRITACNPTEPNELSAPHGGTEFNGLTEILPNITNDCITND